VFAFPVALPIVGSLFGAKGERQRAKSLTSSLRFGASVVNFTLRELGI
jgi:hypothetical protein